jgi:membrane-associated phospholipid phosphatase
MRTIELRRFFVNRLDAEKFVGLHLTLSLIVAAGALWVFAATFEAVLDNATMVRWDLATASAIHQHTTARGLRLFDALSHAGSPTTMIVITVIGCLVLLVRRKPTLFVTWVAAMGGGGILEHILKRAVERHRPSFGASFVTDQSSSFPSGHAMIATLALGMVVYVLIVTRPMRPWMIVAVIVAAFAALMIIGFGRIYLGVHYPSDVLGGFAAGGAWLGICTSIAGIDLHRRGHSLSS